MKPDPQLRLDLEGSHTFDVPFGDWLRAQPLTPWADDKAARGG